jgi:hypothetical protein
LVKRKIKGTETFGPVQLSSDHTTYAPPLATEQEQPAQIDYAGGLPAKMLRTDDGPTAKTGRDRRTGGKEERPLSLSTYMVRAVPIPSFPFPHATTTTTIRLAK